MAAVGMVWNAGEEGGVRYVCGLEGGLAALGEPLRRQGAQVGMDRAERWLAIKRRRAGLEDWLRANFPRAEAVILDFYHAAEHLSDWAKAQHPQSEAAAGRLAQTWCHRLKHEGGREVLSALRALDLSAGSAEVREAPTAIAGLLRESGAPDGLSVVPVEGLADRQWPGGGGRASRWWGNGSRAAACAGVKPGQTPCAT